MSTRPAITGTPEERRDLRRQRRESNRVRHVTSRAQQARNGRELLVVACNAALAAGKRITDDARRDLAAGIARLVEQADVPANRKEQL
jgi:hypothetical protein